MNFMCSPYIKRDLPVHKGQCKPLSDRNLSCIYIFLEVYPFKHILPCVQTLKSARTQPGCGYINFVHILFLVSYYVRLTKSEEIKM